ncbi:putative U box domain, Zinc finger, RING/FYVE/PHD-type [Helianthus annuus]|uniref:Putative zinc finger, RING/FYVE/PHD-type n=1 Tax=Helianthus annuus TaxID=4232 RepID=A0A251U9F6_HELAN|nr:putative U box domain, Zinc finger, RING/FYVE/PHD-type [Helianthus annuus]KAJ0540366.1 putative U box domain, Zinc finger, RING/FYVE/PHD-type [Helianthus annuus]KAJ0548881.1 putative U box domain, Zinc finger, RING/FYVE/PHD-type [Helianthus annuus]KAJ0555109.1 putative U box domain, Zinc finger, RING/FYVE/PHD-type [Helianthus annuus]KAJ0720676.1 putative U box domain, Zinc finger, RING/FYVE/PHD-type [Helianthus annuus]
MLVQSEKVSNHFRAIFRSISVALDVLPLDSLKISVELKDDLGISSWNECYKEIKFLESERSGNKKSDVGILCSLMGVMIYSRCTVFTVVDCDKTPISGDGYSCNHNHFVKSLNVDDFRCPISLEIMSDPVTLTTGHTYDRL